MLRLRVIFVLLLATAATCAEKPQFPSTPLGKRVAALISVINSGEAERIRSFIDYHYASEALKGRSLEDRAAAYLSLYQETGGFELRRVEQSAEAAITILAETRTWHEWYRITAQAQAQKPYRLLGATFRLIPRPAELAPKGRVSDRQIATEVHAYAEKLAKTGLFGGVVLYAVDGKPLLERAYAWHKADETISHRVDERFGLASINKLFTATAIAQLADSGKLAFSDTIGRYMPIFPRERGEKITIHQLLTHTSGIEPLMDATAFDDMRKARLKTRADQIRFLGSRPPVAAPGEKFEYSNAGYMLLDAIVEAVSGEAIEEYVQTHIYAPLGMSRSAAGESTASDLLRFSEGLRGGKVVAAKTLATMMAPQVKTADPEISYGYGVRVQTVNGTRIVGHPGGGPTVSAQFDIYPDEGRTVVVLSRREGATAQRVANRLRELITQR